MDRGEHLLAIDGMDPEARTGLFPAENADLLRAPLDVARCRVLRVEPSHDALRDGFELRADLIELAHVVAHGREERLPIGAGLRRLEPSGQRRLAGDLACPLQLDVGAAEPGADRVALVPRSEHLGPGVGERVGRVLRLRRRYRRVGLRERHRERVNAVVHLAGAGFGVDVDHGLCLSSQPNGRRPNGSSPRLARRSSKRLRTSRSAAVIAGLVGS